MIGITKLDHKRNEWIRKQIGLKNIIARIKQLKWQCAGHVARFSDNRWTKLVTEWLPLNGKKRARPKTRWADEIRKFEGVTWMREASNRTVSKNHGDAFI